MSDAPRTPDVLDSLRAFVADIVRDELDRRTKAADPSRLTVAAYAKRWSLSESTVRVAIREQRLDHSRVGRAVRIPAEAKISKPEKLGVAERSRRTLFGKVTR